MTTVLREKEMPLELIPKPPPPIKLGFPLSRE